MAARWSLPPEVYKAVGQLMSNADLKELSSIVSLALSKLNGISQRFIALQQLFGGGFSQHKGSAADAALAALRDSVILCTSPTVDDGYALANVAICLDGANFVYAQAEPLLKAHQQRTYFMLASLSAWTRRVTTNGAFDVPATFDNVFNMTMTSFHLEVQAAHANKRQKLDCQEPQPQSTTPSKTAGNLYWITTYVVYNDKADQLRASCRALSIYTCLQQLGVPSNILIPFLKYSQAVAAQCLTGGSGGAFQNVTARYSTLTCAHTLGRSQTPRRTYRAIVLIAPAATAGSSISCCSVRCSKSSNFR